jgi:hypothetical protein
MFVSYRFILLTCHKLLPVHLVEAFVVKFPTRKKIHNHFGTIYARNVTE